MKKHCFINKIPVTISTDKDVSLLNALRTELPEVKHLLCRWHISKNILGHIPRFFPGLEGNSATHILQGWNRAVSSRTEEVFESSIETFIRSLPKRNSSNTTTYDPSKFVAYIKTTWLDKDREKFVSAWTDKFTHLGTTSSSRIEGAHAILKRHLKSLIGDLGYVFNLMDTVLKQQHTEILVLSNKQAYKASNHYRTPLLDNLQKKITEHALK
ncbi:hypothetical protein, partial, partial [Parasitella parasitica]